MKISVKNHNQINFNSKTKFKNYLKKLKTMPSQFNRPISESHIKTMQESVEVLGVLRPIIVIKTSSFGEGYTLYKGDGQHLTQAIINVPNNNLTGIKSVIEVDIERIDEIIPFVSKLNTTSKSWSLQNYLDAWCTHGLEDYNFLAKQREETGLGLGGLIEVYLNRRASGNKTFKDGKFHAKRKIGNQTIALYKTAVASGLKQSNSSWLAFSRFIVDNSQIDRQEMLNTIRTLSTMFSIKGDREYFLLLFRTHCK